MYDNSSTGGLFGVAFAVALAGFGKYLPLIVSVVVVLIVAVAVAIGLYRRASRRNR